jgi:hypothetical protein
MFGNALTNSVPKMIETPIPIVLNFGKMITLVWHLRDTVFPFIQSDTFLIEISG